MFMYKYTSLVAIFKMIASIYKTRISLFGISLPVFVNILIKNEKKKQKTTTFTEYFPFLYTKSSGIKG